jgi:hypothetical protein
MVKKIEHYPELVDPQAAPRKIPRRPRTTKLPSNGFVPVPIRRRSLLKAPRLALKSIFQGVQAKFVNAYRLFAMRMQISSGGRG